MSVGTSGHEPRNPSRVPWVFDNSLFEEASQHGSEVGEGEGEVQQQQRSSITSTLARMSLRVMAALQLPHLSMLPYSQDPTIHMSTGFTRFSTGHGTATGPQQQQQQLSRAPPLMFALRVGSNQQQQQQPSFCPTVASTPPPPPPGPLPLAWDEAGGPASPGPPLARWQSISKRVIDSKINRSSTLMRSRFPAGLQGEARGCSLEGAPSSLQRPQHAAAASLDGAALRSSEAAILDRAVMHAPEAAILDRAVMHAPEAAILDRAALYTPHPATPAAAGPGCTLLPPATPAAAGPGCTSFPPGPGAPEPDSVEAQPAAPASFTARAGHWSKATALTALSRVMGSMSRSKQGEAVAGPPAGGGAAGGEAGFSGQAGVDLASVASRGLGMMRAWSLPRREGGSGGGTRWRRRASSAGVMPPPSGSLVSACGSPAGGSTALLALPEEEVMQPQPLPEEAMHMHPQPLASRAQARGGGRVGRGSGVHSRWG